jgi:hypothetical protein
MSRSSNALLNLRAVVILIVLALHSVLPYLASLPPSPYPFDNPPYQWLAFPIIDSQRWFGFDLFCAWRAISRAAVVLGCTLIANWGIPAAMGGALPLLRLDATTGAARGA